MDNSQGDQWLFWSEDGVFGFGELELWPLWFKNNIKCESVWVLAIRRHSTSGNSIENFS